MCGREAKGGLPPPKMRLLPGEGYQGGATQRAVLHTNGALGGGYPPHSKRRHCCYHVVGYPPPLCLYSVSVVKEKLPSRTS